MLQLLPALLLLMLHGPASLERASLSERLPEALRVICEIRPTDEEGELDSQSQERERLAELLAISHSQAEIASALVQYFGLQAPVPFEPPSLESDSEDSVAIPIFTEPIQRLTAMSLRSHPNRAGPCLA